jgi:hypothetical protein
LELDYATSAVPSGHKTCVKLLRRFLLAKSCWVHLSFILPIAELLSAVLQHVARLGSLFGVLVVVQVTVIRVELLVCTHTVCNVLTSFLLTLVVGVFGHNLLWRHFQLLKEELS